PTCRSLGTKPASTAARDAPIAAPSSSTSGSSTVLKFSAALRPRPPETIIRASVSCGRSLLVALNETNSILRAPASISALRFSTGATAPPGLAASNAVPRTVNTLIGPSISTVAITLPAYVGRTKLWSSLIAVISDAIPAPRRAAEVGGAVRQGRPGPGAEGVAG